MPQVTVHHMPGQHMAVHLDDAEAQAHAAARRKTARYVFALVDANPDHSLRELADAYTAVDHPDADVLATLRYLASQLQGRP